MLLRQETFSTSERSQSGPEADSWTQPSQQRDSPIRSTVAKKSESQTTTASACGKSILIGEHAVVYGAHAIALPVPAMRMQIRVREIQQNGTRKLGRHSLDMRLSGQRVSEHILSVAQQALELLGITPCKLEIEGESNLWIGAGLGSSASLCVGLLRCFSAHWGIGLEPIALALFANQLEACFHGKPSGLDVSVVALEQLILFRKGTAPVPLPPNENQVQCLHFAVLDSQMRSSTKAMVEKAAPYFAGSSGGLRVQRFDDLTLATMRCLNAGDVGGLAETLNTAASWLDEAGVVAGANRDLQDLALAKGALAAKITGAGGGGAVLALLDPAREPLTQLAQLTGVLGSHRVLGISL